MNALPYLFAGFSGIANVEKNSHAASGTLEDLSSTAVRSSSNIVKKLVEVSPAIANTCVLRKIQITAICVLYIIHVFAN